jgi:hypothetical protein
MFDVVPEVFDASVTTFVALLPSVMPPMATFVTLVSVDVTLVSVDVALLTTFDVMLSPAVWMVWAAWVWDKKKAELKQCYPES